MAIQPAEFEFRWCAPRSRGLTVVYREDRLLHGDSREDPHYEVIPAESELAEFWGIVDALHVWEWEPLFQRRHVVDGDAWKLHIRHAGQVVESEGWTAGPAGLEILKTAIQALIDGHLCATALRGRATTAATAFEPYDGTIDELIAHLKRTRNDLDYERIARTLGRRGWPALRAVPMLIESASPFAALALAAIGDAAKSAPPDEVAPLLAPVLPIVEQALNRHTGDPELLLSFLSKVTPERVADFLRHPSTPVVRETAKQIAASGGAVPQSALSQLVSRLHEVIVQPSSVRDLAEALCALSPSDGERAIDALRLTIQGRLEDGNPSSRTAAIETLAALPPAPANADALAHLLISDPNRGVRLAACAALEHLGRTAVLTVPALLPALSDEGLDAPTRVAIAGMLRRIAPDYIDQTTAALAKILTTPRPSDVPVQPHNDALREAADLLEISGPLSAPTLAALEAASASPSALTRRLVKEVLRIAGRREIGRCKPST